MMRQPSWPVPFRGARTDAQRIRSVENAIERVIADVPPPRTRRVSDAGRAAEKIVREAAQKAAVLSGSLALPPGPIGMLTVLPDLYLIWKTQRQMVADIFGLYGRRAAPTRTHMLYCLFRHAASHVLRDLAVRTGQRIIVQEIASGALQGIAQKVGVTVTKRGLGTAGGRWGAVGGGGGG